MKGILRSDAVRVPAFFASVCTIIFVMIYVTIWLSETRYEDAYKVKIMSQDGAICTVRSPSGEILKVRGFPSANQDGETVVYVYVNNLGFKEYSFE